MSAPGPVTAGKSLGWYWNRLRLMSLPEIAYRVKQQAGKAWSARQAQSPESVPAASLERFGRPWCTGWPVLRDDERQVLLAAADRVLQGRWTVFALRDAPLGFPPAWNTDPLTGTAAPMGYGKRLNYRDERLVGNIKYLWEPSRHLELTTLAQAWRASGDRRYLDGCATLLASWLDACPYPRGVHWASSLELAIRLLNWAVTWHLLGGAGSPLFEGADGRRLRDRWLESVWRHARFIEGYFSRHSSANNHLLGEYMGLFVAGITWPCWPQAERWRRTGQRGFEREALRQNAPDGVNREQAIYYHHEVADMMLWCGLFGRANETDFSDAYWQRLERMLVFVAALRDEGGHLPAIGDADDALMVRLDPREDFDPYASLLASGARLFGRDDLRAPARDVKTEWMLGARPPSLRSTAPITQDFPEGGYWVLRGGPQRAQLVADAGPLGYLSIAAHGHADALAFTLSAAGRELLIDPGTFAYHTQPRWRDYFRSTAAHNTLRVDRQDQSEIGGAFMWLRKANARCLAVSRDAVLERWSGEHDGYRRLPGRPVHRRSITLDRRDGIVSVVDRLEGEGTHEVELHWHLAEDAQPAIEPDGSLRVRCGPLVMRLRCEGDTPLVLTLHRGEEHPPLGWISRRFDRKMPTWTARFAGHASAPASWTTRIEIDTDAGIPEPRAAAAGVQDINDLEAMALQDSQSKGSSQ